MLVILDYGIGNVNSIKNMLKKIGTECVASNDPKTIGDATKLILPGVGHFDYCMSQVKAQAFFPVLNDKVLNEKTPLLGVCVGCQMLFDTSEEGDQKGLGWIEGRVVRFDRQKAGAALKVPHMSWSDVVVSDGAKLYDGIPHPRFYFVHSYHVIAENPDYVTAQCDYGYRFDASVQKENIQGVQFHPEKSHKFGMQLFRNFAEEV